jgi:hypothetical protein
LVATQRTGLLAVAGAGAARATAERVEARMTAVNFILKTMVCDVREVRELVSSIVGVLEIGVFVFVMNVDLGELKLTYRIFPRSSMNSETFQRTIPRD